MSKTDLKRGGKIVGVVLAIILLTVTIAESYIEFGKYIWFGVTVEGVSLGGLDEANANRKLQQAFEAKYSLPVVLHIGGLGHGQSQSYTYQAADLGYQGDFAQAVSEAYKVGRSGGLLRRWQERQAKLDIQLNKYWAKPQVFAKITPLANLYQREDRPARVEVVDNQVKISAGQDGYFFDKQVFYQSLAKLDPARPIDMQVDLQTLMAYPTSEIIAGWGLEQNRSEFETSYLTGGNRGNNIEIAAASLNGVIIYPGTEMSFNDLLGERTPDKGYKPAPTIIGGVHEDDVGGGICQVTTTLYNCILQGQDVGAKFKITEHHSHSLPVEYAEDGKDATVSYGYKDFKFIYQGETPLVIKAVAKDGQLWVALGGKYI